ncbi:uncharacterized protein LOC114916542 [Cajanus cajan]|uniref:uncharacterized protein LOC114916542 n=1 Tax=Cajanus cajan TaxID=3821 RepID=UPI0010FB37B1|nr:uncharacterized protein LOC114916542 [Cajanus cajan]
MFVGTLTGIALKWFSRLPDRSITDFNVLSRKFVTQFAANKVNPPTIVDLLNVHQGLGETLKEYLTKFSQEAAKIPDIDEKMIVVALRKGLRLGPYGESLIHNAVKTMTEALPRAMYYIKVEESEMRKREMEKQTINNAKPLGGNQYLKPKSNWAKRED